MRILVTGGAGFIGSHVVDEYMRHMHDVAVVDDLSTGNLKNLEEVKRRSYFPKFYQGDISDYDFLKTVFEDFKPDVVNHHAAQASVPTSVKNPWSDARVNIFGTLNLLMLCKEHNVKKFIYAGTGGALYNSLKLPIDEQEEALPLSPYGCSKYASEIYLKMLAFNTGMRYVIFRYPNVYGPRQNPNGESGVIAIFINKLLKGEQPYINGDGLQSRDFLYVKDIARANLKALMVENGIYNLGTQRTTNINLLFDKIKNVLSPTTKAIYSTIRISNYEVRHFSLSYVKFYSKTKWTPKYDIDKGLQETIKWFQNEVKKNG